MNVKKALVCGGLLLALVGCAAAASSCGMTLVEANASVPVDSTYILPSIEFGFDAMKEHITFNTFVQVNRKDTVYTFSDYGFYYLYSATLKYNDDGVFWDSLQFARFDSDVDSFFYNFGYQCYFTPWFYFSPVGNAGAYENWFSSPSNLSMTWGLSNTGTMSTMSRGTYPYLYDVHYGTHNGDPSLAYPSAEQFNSYYDAVAANRLLNQNYLNETFQQGYDAGDDAGYQRGWHEGRVKYEQEISDSGFLFPSLFSAVLGVPFSVLNGLGDFAVFGTPLISISITLLFAAAVFWFIRKLL